MALAAHLEYYESAHGERARLWLQEQPLTADLPGVLVKIHLATPSGLIIETDRPAAADEPLEIAFSPDVRIGARILWASGKLFGCEFENEAADRVTTAPRRDEDHPPENFRRRRTDTALANSAGETLGGRMRHLRFQRGMMQDDVAASLGVSVASVSHWESDRSFPKRGRLVDLAQLFGVPAADLASFYTETKIVEEIDRLAVVRSEIATILGVEAAQIKILVEP
ncbi:transcriptional regulator with XRE-family HTH domain [Sphingopyxis sp. OAS728]|uniref:helix-turn-helix domain-containing protein n=1 Tax=Sphingopyxis sp. OAS728 TaxID=2663823 RepID=UPI00178B7A1E|nr:helix-turn-helix transcriptional regulator [Sphingopyxis sp. OAS728]MBE1526390.1 transcriptional regulator with XRE-family HTH domain [Sphingopyxis sp. OAS728]